MTFEIKLSKGIGNTILALPLITHLQRHGENVELYVCPDRGESDRAIKETLQVFNQDYNVNQRGGKDIWEGDNRMLFLRQPEWVAWFSLFGIKPPHNSEIGLSVKATKKRVSDVILAPCTKDNWPMKEWPHWQRLIHYLPGCAVVGKPGDGGELAGCFVDKRGQSIMDTAKIIRGSDIVIAEEGGIAHLAAAVGKPTLILAGGTLIAKNLSFMDTAYYLQAPGLWRCRPCQGVEHKESRLHYGCRPEELTGGFAQCMYDLKPGRVLTELNRRGISWQQRQKQL